MQQLGEGIGIAPGSAASYVHRLMKGKVRLSPEQIEALAAVLSQATLGREEQRKTQREMEAFLATSAGQQMPALLRLTFDQAEFDEVLAMLSGVSSAVLEAAESKPASTWRPTEIWPLVAAELANVVAAWQELMRLEASLDSSSELKYEVLEHQWDAIQQRLVQASTPLQLAYAYTLWARVLTVGGNTELAITRADEALRALGNPRLRPERARSAAFSLGSRANTVLGDNNRAKGHFDVALQNYSQARTMAANLPQDMSVVLSSILDRKEFSTYLMARVEPPADRTDRIRALYDRSDASDETKAGVMFSLAWLERGRRGLHLHTAREYGERGLQHALSHARATGDPHVEAIGHQYLGETLLHAGHLVQAESQLGEAIRLFRYPRRGRVGFTYLLLGRVFAYRSLVSHEVGQMSSCLATLSQARQAFSTSDKAFTEGQRLRERRYSNYQRAQLLVEWTKWDAFEAVLRGKMIGQSSERIMLQPAALFDQARARLSEIDQLPHYQQAQFNKSASEVNRLLVDVLEWYLLRRDHRQLADLEHRATELLEILSGEADRIPVSLLGAQRFEHESDGHRSRLHALRGLLRCFMRLGSMQSGTQDLVNSIRLSLQYDHLAVLDCYWLAGLALGATDRLLLLERHLRDFELAEVVRSFAGCP